MTNLKLKDLLTKMISNLIENNNILSLMITNKELTIINEEIPKPILDMQRMKNSDFRFELNSIINELITEDEI